MDERIFIGGKLHKGHDEELKTPSIYIATKCYALQESQFEKLIGSSNRWKDFAIDTVFIGIGFLIKFLAVFAMYIYKGFTDPLANAKPDNCLSKIESWEFSALFIVAIMALTFFLISKLGNSEREVLIKEIRNEFNKKDTENDTQG